jgi:putative peptidoglycan lipid II flippase
LSDLKTTQPSAGRAAAVMVATGIFLSKIAGLVRERVFAHFFGNSEVADAFRAALRIPNFLQNLFGEGVLSASFIPVYARLRAEKRDQEASQLAEAIFALLALTTTILVALGIVFTPALIALIAPGFKGATRDLTIQLVRILFPGVGLLVFSAWCLGVLNSHRKFFLSYTAPVIWNVAIIVAFYLHRNAVDDAALARIVAYGTVIGSALQFGIQLPVVLRFLWPMSIHLHVGEHVRSVVRSFGPIFVARGVVQISAYIDGMLASLLPVGAVAALGYAQTLNQLPVSLFGMSVSAAELPAMSSALGTTDQIAQTVRERLARGLEQISYFVVPSVVAFLLLGNVVVATLYRSGAFNQSDVIYVWAVLAGSAVGLLASTSGRLYSSAFYALRDTKTPLRFATIRVALTLILGYLCALPLPRLLHIDQKWGVAGLTLSAGIAGWVEFALLRRALHDRTGRVAYPVARLLKLYAAAVAAAVVAIAIYRYGLSAAHFFTRPIIRGIVELGIYGTLYVAITQAMGISSLDRLIQRLRRR